jgi:quercetin dioxygenase-like cupin family protein
MPLSRRGFLKTTGAVLATPAILSAQVDAHLTQTQKINMEIKRVGSQPSVKGPADWFTGTVRVDPLFQANAPALAAGGQCHVRTGCSHRWHTHPLYQTLIVIAGCGWAQREGGPIEEVHSGDVILFPRREKSIGTGATGREMGTCAPEPARDHRPLDPLEHWKGKIIWNTRS